MSVPLTGTGGYFTRQGTIIGEFNRVAALYGSALTAGFNAIWAQFASSDQAALDGLADAVAAYSQSGLSYQNTLVADGQTASVLQVNDDTSLVPYTFQQSVVVLVSQMKGASQTVNRPTLGSTVTPGGSNLGDTTLVTTTTNQFGDPLDMIFAETVNFICPTDSGANYQASIAANGTAAVPGTSGLWPAGSGAQTSLTVTDANVNGIVTDGGFNNWTGTGANTPVSWTIINGSPGVTVFQSVGGGLRSLSAAQLTSDGASATQLAQTLTLSVDTVYCAFVYAKINTLDASGQFILKFCNNNGTVLTNDAGANLQLTKNFNGQITTSFQCFPVFFSTPRQLPISTQVRFGFNTAPTAGRNLFLSLAGVVAATQLYPGGPFVAAIAGANRTALNDTWTIAYTNSLGSQSFVRGTDRLYNMRLLGIYFPSSGSPTISDSLVLH